MFESYEAEEARHANCPEGQMVFRSASEWNQWWQRCNASPPPPDFSKKTAAGVFLGQRPHSGYSVRITEMVQTGKSTEIVFEAPDPEPGGMYAMVVTYPSAIVMFDRMTGPVTFRKKARMEKKTQ